MTDRPYPNLPRNRTIEIAPGVPMEFVLVLPGSFVMGDKEGSDWSGEKAEHLVNITRPYYFGRYPVTQAQWRAVMKDNPANFRGDDNRPVESVTWKDIVGTAAATGFLARLSAEPGYTYRLPTEAEWEYAAKGGHLAPPIEMRSGEKSVQAADLYPAYTGGEDVNAAAWQRENDAYSTLRTGYRQPNVLGFYGMSGNVYDWCQDIYDSKAYEKGSENGKEVIDPLVEEFGRSRVVRGGSWIDDPRNCRSASRRGRHPSSRLRSLGFRLVLSPSSG